MRVQQYKYEVLRKLAQGGAIGVATRVEMPETAIDRKVMAVLAILSTEDVDRSLDVVLSKGLRLEEHKRSPVGLLDHAEEYKLPVSKYETPEGEYTVKVMDGYVTGRAYYDEHSEMSEQVFGLIDRGFLRGHSIGFRPLKAKKRQIWDSDGYEDEKARGLLVEECELLEASVTPIADNPKCISVATEVLHKNRLNGRPLLDTIKKSLLPYATPLRRNQVVGGYTPPVTKAARLNDSLSQPSWPAVIARAMLLIAGKDAESGEGPLSDKCLAVLDALKAMRDDPDPEVFGGPQDALFKSYTAWVKEWQDRGLVGGGPRHRWYNPDLKQTRTQIVQPGTGRATAAARVAERKKMTAEAAHEQLAGILSGADVPEDAVERVHSVLAGMYRDEVRKLAKKVGAAGSGKLAQMAKSVAEAAVAKAKAGNWGRAEPATTAGSNQGVYEPGDAVNMPTEELHVDPGRFQFKLNVNREGVTEEFKEVDVFNPDFAGVISVWKDPADGKTYVINGHHRYEMARRLGHPRLAVRYIKASDHERARALGALINIAEGRGTALDAAKFIRDSGTSADTLKKYGLSFSGKLASEASILARLSPRMFNELLVGRLDQGKALAVGAHLPDHDRQDELFAWMQKKDPQGKKFGPTVVAEMAAEMAATPTVQSDDDGMFPGFGKVEDSLFAQRAELKAFVRSEMAKEFNDFSKLASERRAANVSRVEGNTLNTDENRRMAQELGQVRDTYAALVNYRGPISDAINAAAEEYAKAKTEKQRNVIKQQAIERVRQLATSQKDSPVLGGGTGATVRPGDGDREGQPAAGPVAAAEDARGGVPAADGVSGPKEGDRDANGLVFRGGRWHKEGPAPAPPASTLGASVSSPIHDITPDTVGPLWSRMRDEIGSHDPKLSPAAAGEIAAARIMNGWGEAARQFRDTLDRKARAGEPISDADDALYGELDDRHGPLTRKLEQLSGIRAWTDLREHPLANRPLDAEPLEDVAAKQRTRAEELRQAVPAPRQSARGAQEAAKLPSSVRSTVQHAVDTIKDRETALEQARQTDSKFQGGGRYELPIIRGASSASSRSGESAVVLVPGSMARHVTPTLGRRATELPPSMGGAEKATTTAPQHPDAEAIGRISGKERDHLQAYAARSSVDVLRHSLRDLENKIRHGSRGTDYEMAGRAILSQALAEKEAEAAKPVAKLPDGHEEFVNPSHRAKTLQEWADAQPTLDNPDDNAAVAAHVAQRLADGYRLPRAVIEAHPEIVQSHIDATRKADEDDRQQLEAIEPGDTGFLGGYYVQRKGPDTFRTETPDGYVEGPASKVLAHIKEQQRGASQSDRRAVEDALGRHSRTAAGEAEGLNAAGGPGVEALRKLAPGTRLVVTGGGYRGRTARLVKEKDPESGRIRLMLDLDGSPERIPANHTNVEPLDPSQSWRRQQPTVTRPQAAQGELLTAEAGRAAVRPKGESAPAAKLRPSDDFVEDFASQQGLFDEGGRQHSLFGAARKTFRKSPAPEEPDYASGSLLALLSLAGRLGGPDDDAVRRAMQLTVDSLEDGPDPDALKGPHDPVFKSYVAWAKAWQQVGQAGKSKGGQQQYKYRDDETGEVRVQISTPKTPSKKPKLKGRGKGEAKAGEKPAPEAARPGAAGVSAPAKKLFDLAMTLNKDARNGATISLTGLRQKAKGLFPNKEAFDKAVLELAEKELVDLHGEATPKQLSQAERDALVEDTHNPGNYFRGMARTTTNDPAEEVHIPPARQEPAKAPARGKPAPLSRDRAAADALEAIKGHLQKPGGITADELQAVADMLSGGLKKEELQSIARELKTLVSGTKAVLGKNIADAMLAKAKGDPQAGKKPRKAPAKKEKPAAEEKPAEQPAAPAKQAEPAPAGEPAAEAVPSSAAPSAKPAWAPDDSQFPAGMAKAPPEAEAAAVDLIAKFKEERPLNNISFDVLYKQLNAEHPLTKDQFRALMLDLHKRGEIRLHPFTRPKHEMPDEALMVNRDWEDKYYAEPAKGRTQEPQAGRQPAPPKPSRELAAPQGGRREAGRESAPPAGDHYAMLGLKPDATDEQVMEAYRRETRRWHPDRNQSEGSAARFNAIREAFEVLGDPKRRDHYDRTHSDESRGQAARRKAEAAARVTAEQEAEKARQKHEIRAGAHAKTKELLAEKRAEYGRTWNPIRLAQIGIQIHELKGILARMEAEHPALKPGYKAPGTPPAEPVKERRRWKDLDAEGKGYRRKSSGNWRRRARP